MSKRDLFDRRVLDEIVDPKSAQRNKRRLIANAGLCAAADAVCIYHAAEHTSNGNYAAALLVTTVGILTCIIGYHEAVSAHTLRTTPLEELKPQVLKIHEVRNPILDYLED